MNVLVQLVGQVMIVVRNVLNGLGVEIVSIKQHVTEKIHNSPVLLMGNVFARKVMKE